MESKESKFQVGDMVIRTGCDWCGVERGSLQKVASLDGLNSIGLEGCSAAGFDANLFDRAPTAGIPFPILPGNVGDVTSTAKGSAARYNSGKAPMDLLPLFVLAESYGNPTGRIGGYGINALQSLSQWQRYGDKAHLFSAIKALGTGAWEEAAHVLEYGKGKYAAWNWAKGFQWSVPTGCCVRHLVAIIDGQEDDSESGLSHRGHALCNLVMLLTFMETFPEGDDRPRTLA